MGRRVINLADHVRAVRESDNGFDIGLGDGNAPVFVPGPELWSDDALDLTDTDPVAAAKLIIGEGEYARFKAAGGSAGLLFDMVRKTQQVEDVGESDSSTD